MVTEAENCACRDGATCTCEIFECTCECACETCDDELEATSECPCGGNCSCGGGKAGDSFSPLEC